MTHIVHRDWTPLARRWLAAAALLAGLGLAATPGRAAAEVYLAPTSDTYLSASSPRHNFGHAKRLRIDGRPQQRALLRFNLTGLDLSSVVQARLYLYSQGDARTGLAIRRGSPRYWHEMRVTFTDRLGQGDPVLRTGPLRARQWATVDVTRLLSGPRLLQIALTTRSRAVRVVSSREDLATYPRLVLVRRANSAAAAPRPVVSPSSVLPCGTSPVAPAWGHVVWVVMENKGFEQIGAQSAPYINSLVTRCGLATNFLGEAHPSLPNYIAMTSGSTQGIGDDSGPSSHPLNVPSIFSQLGSDWRALQESMPSNCAKSDAGLYAVRHNPAVYYTNIAGACATQDVPLSDPPDLSARFTFITPNECNDMHSCPTGQDAAAQIRNGDGWLASWMPKLLDSSQYKSGNTAIFLTWDEDDYSGINHVATIVISPSTPAGLKVGTQFDHYALLRTTQEMLGLPAILGQAASAPSMAADFHL
jgi:phosphatidylinositol-3-phosphatase